MNLRLMSLSILLFSCSDNSAHIESSADSGFLYKKLGKFELEREKQKSQDGNPDSAYKIANHYVASGIKQNRENYRLWLEKATELGHVEASGLILTIYLTDGNCALARQQLTSNIERFGISADINLGRQIEVDECRVVELQRQEQ